MKTDLLRIIRYYRRHLLHGLSVVGLLGIGVAATTTVVGVADGVLFRPLPYDRPESLAQLEQWVLGSTRSGAIQRADYEIVKRLPSVVEGVGLIGGGTTVTWEGPAGREEVATASVTENMFAVLGTRFHLGRGFEYGDLQSSEQSAVLTWAAWVRRFGRDPHIVGRLLLLSGEPTKVIGVLPREFVFPVATTAKAEVVTLRRFYGPPRSGEIVSTPIVRVRSGMSFDRAQVAISAALSTPTAVSRVKLTPLSFSLFSFPSMVLWVLVGAASCVVVAVGGNVTGLMMASHRERRPDYELQIALGCGVKRMCRWFCLEAVLIAVTSAGVGLAAALVAADWLLTALPDAYVGLVPAAMPRRMVFIGTTVALVMSLTCCVLAFLRPLIVFYRWETRLPVRAYATQIAGRFVVAAQAAGAVVVLGASIGLLSQVFSAQNVNLGYDPQRTYAATFSQPNAAAVDQAVARRRILAAIRQLPGIDAAGISDLLPMSGMPSVAPPIRLGRNSLARWEVSAGFLEAVGSRLQAGRTFNEDDDRAASPLAILNGAAAALLWPNQPPIGQVIPVEGERQLTVIGVVETMRAGYLLDPGPEAYVLLGKVRRSPSVVTMKTDLPVAEIDRSLSEALSRAGIRSVVSRPEKVVAVLNRGIEDITFPGSILTTLGLLAWLVASGGIYSLTHRWVGGESRNFGIRLAVGASPQQLRQHVLRTVMLPVVGGVLCGGIVSVIIGIYEPGEYSAVGQTGVSAALLAMLAMLVAATLAAAFACRHATRAEPATLLRATT